MWGGYTHPTPFLTPRNTHWTRGVANGDTNFRFNPKKSIFHITFSLSFFLCFLPPLISTYFRRQGGGGDLHPAPVLIPQIFRAYILKLSNFSNAICFTAYLNFDGISFLFQLYSIVGHLPLFTFLYFI